MAMHEIYRRVPGCWGIINTYDSRHYKHAGSQSGGIVTSTKFLIKKTGGLKCCRLNNPHCFGSAWPIQALLVAIEMTDEQSAWKYGWQELKRKLIDMQFLIRMKIPTRGASPRSRSC